MSYIQFHLLFNVPLLLLLWWWNRERITKGHWKWIGLVALIVVSFTYPWDNWAVGQGIWDFPDDRVLFRVGHIPIEEIAFFLFETLAVSMLTLRWITTDETE